MAGRNPNARSRDMALSMAVIMVPILLLAWFFSASDDTPPTPVDVAGTLQRATAESPYPLLHADDLGDGWTAVRVAWAKAGDAWINAQPATSNSWQVGYLSPDETYFGVQQRDGGQAELIRSTTREGKELDGEVEAAGLTWLRYESPDGRTRSLVNTDGDVAAVVTADTDFATLEAFASALVTAG